MLFSVNKGRDDLRDSLLMMSEEGNGNEVHNGKMTRSRMIGNIFIYLCVCMCVCDRCVYVCIHVFVYVY